MKKVLSILIAVMLLASAFAMAETYTYTAQGFGGAVTVSIDVEDGAIVACAIEAYDETPAVGGAAAASLAEAIVAANGMADAVAGATMTSNAVAAALQSAMVEAGLAEAVEAKMLSGTYTGSAHGFSCIDKVTVDVTVSEAGIDALVLQDTFRPDADSYENPYMCKGAFAILHDTIIENQSLAVDSVTGATGSSTGIKGAVRDALTQAYIAGGCTAEEAASAINARFTAPQTHEEKQAELTYDVVVVGAGASGAIASLAAIDEGVSVLNVEKTFRWGGQSMMTGGPKVFGSQTTPEIIEEEVAKYEQIIASCRLGKDAVWNDPEYVAAHADTFTDFNHDAYRAIIPASGKGALLMIENGMHFTPGMDMTAMGDMAGGPMPDMAMLMAMEKPEVSAEEIENAAQISLSYKAAEEYYETMYENFLAKGGDALLSTRATELIADDAGNIVGLYAIGDDGTQYTIHAGRVILATGGFGANEEMVAEYTAGGSDWIYYGWQGNQGDGIRMAMAAGANPYNLDAYPMSHQRMGARFITCFETEQTPEGRIWSPNDLTVVLAVNPDGVYVTADGTPFRSEEYGSFLGGFSGSMGSYCLGSRYFIVYSESQLEQYRTAGIADTTMGFQNVGEGIPANYPLGDWVDTVLNEAANQGWAWKVNSLEEGDAVLGMNDGTLAAAYAADPAQAAGAQDEGGFWIIQGGGLSISRCGGVEVNADMQAVRADGSAIENLYVVGNDGFGNIMATGAEYSIGGDAGMWCFGSGYIAGKAAAAK